MKFLLLVLALVGAPPADSALRVADDPVPPPVIVVPSKPVQAGHNVRVVVKLPDSRPDGFYNVTYAWFVYPTVDDLQVDRLDGTIAWFGSGVNDETFTVMVTATYIYPDRVKKLVITSAEETVVVRKTASPTPVPTPTPVPEPVPIRPTFPPGKFGLSQLTYDSVMTVPLDQGTRSKEAARLAKNYRSVVDAIDSAVQAGSSVTPVQLINMTIDLNRETLAEHLSSWTPALDRIAQSANSQKAKFQTTDDWKAAWTEIAIALEAVK